MLNDAFLVKVQPSNLDAALLRLTTSDPQKHPLLFASSPDWSIARPRR